MDSLSSNGLGSHSNALDPWSAAQTPSKRRLPHERGVNLRNASLPGERHRQPELLTDHHQRSCGSGGARSGRFAVGVRQRMPRRRREQDGHAHRRSQYCRCRIALADVDQPAWTQPHMLEGAAAGAHRYAVVRIARIEIP